MADSNTYFQTEIPPTNLEETRKTIQAFTTSHIQNGRNIVFITSGGTTVPLENNTVRYIDNFSSGSRGALSAEYFLANRYAVIFVYRKKSALPFQQYFNDYNALEFLSVEDSGKPVLVNESKAPGLKEVLLQYKEIKRNGTLLQIEFTTLSSYLFLLRMSAATLNVFGSRIMFYLAAAVSDFYIPREHMAMHKIQSSEGPLMLNLQQTPKLLQPLVKEWSPNAFIVSFKLETDVNIISKKARESLHRNTHQVVVSNILQTRRKTVVIVTATEENAIWMSDSELEQGKDIEQKIVADLTKKHSDFIKTNALQGFTTTGNDLSLDKGFPITTTSGQVVYLSEGNTFQLQGKLGEGSATALLLGAGNITQSPTPINFALNQFTVRKDSSPSTPPTNTNNESNIFPSPSTPNLPKFKVLCESTLSDDMKTFIESFKNKRMTLGYTQEDVGNELSRTNGPTYSQSFISRFESKQLGCKASERMRPILQAWLEAKDIDSSTGIRVCKKRRRRTSFTSDALSILIENFDKNPKPTAAEIAEIAQIINIEPVTVKVWFCNRKQMEKRRSLGKIKTDNTVKSELEARCKVKEDDSIENEQFETYSLGRLQPLVNDDADAPHTVVTTTTTTTRNSSTTSAAVSPVVAEESVESSTFLNASTSSVENIETTNTPPVQYSTTVSTMPTPQAEDEAAIASLNP